MQGINRVVITGNLTRDPELKTFGETTLCNLRIANNTRVKERGEWAEKANYVDVVVFGRQAESCNTYLAKGRSVMVDGRLDFREWDAQDGTKRSVLRIVAENVQFIDSGQRDGGSAPAPAASEQAPPVTPAQAEDDIPF
jgi:single-strand DNA-binding protein